MKEVDELIEYIRAANPTLPANINRYTTVTGLDGFLESCLLMQKRGDSQGMRLLADFKAYIDKPKPLPEAPNDETDTKPHGRPRTK